jgi:cAMP-dependent protein kinase regulator
MHRRTWIDPHLARVPLFRDLSKEELHLVSGIATELDLPAGKRITVEGRPGYEFVVIERGYVEVRHGERAVASRGPGDYVGEIALVADRPRTATVVAMTPVSVAVIGRREFNALLDRVPTLAAQVRAVAAERLADLGEQPPASVDGLARD